jgi:hypothetical protein
MFQIFPQFSNLVAVWSQHRTQCILEEVIKKQQIDKLIQIILNNPSEFLSLFETNIEYILPHINSKFWAKWQDIYSAIDVNCMYAFEGFIRTGHFRYENRRTPNARIVHLRPKTVIFFSQKYYEYLVKNPPEPINLVRKNMQV